MTPPIRGIIISPLEIIEDNRGAVMHMLRANEPHFIKFGEVYFSMIRPNVIKAWKRHKEMTLNIAVPIGRVRLVAYDDRENSPSTKIFNEFLLGPSDLYALITIPPMLWYGFQNIGPTDAFLANCATIPHNPEESEQLNIENSVIDFSWTTN